MVSNPMKRGDILIDGDEESQQALSFAVYHLISAANPEYDRVSIDARALIGDALGRVFWDIELYLRSDGGADRSYHA